MSHLPPVRLPSLPSLRLVWNVKLESVFSLEIKEGGVFPARVDCRWQALPRGSEGIGVRELSLIVVSALQATDFSFTLSFVIRNDTVSAPVPEDASLSVVGFKDFQFEHEAAHSSLHGKWKASSVRSIQCSETLRSIGQVATFSHDMEKLKVA